MDYEFEDFTMSDMEDILEYWQDVSQDPKFISNETGMELDKVIQILDTLQRRGDISGFKKIEKKMEGKILLFEDLNPETVKSLKLSQLTKSGSEYFFDEKDIDMVYDAHIFEVRTTKMYFEKNLVIIPLNITYKNQDYKMVMLYTPNDEVFYGTDNGKNGISKVKEALGEQNMEIFDDVTLQIINERIPVDFWEVRDRQN